MNKNTTVKMEGFMKEIKKRMKSNSEQEGMEQIMKLLNEMQQSDPASYHKFMAEMQLSQNKPKPEMLNLNKTKKLIEKMKGSKVVRESNFFKFLNFKRIYLDYVNYQLLMKIWIFYIN